MQNVSNGENERIHLFYRQLNLPREWQRLISSCIRINTKFRLNIDEIQFLKKTKLKLSIFCLFYCVIPCVNVASFQRTEKSSNINIDHRGQTTVTEHSPPKPPNKWNQVGLTERNEPRGHMTITQSRIITKTCLYNFDPLKPHFNIVKLGFTGVYIIFLNSAQKHRFLWVLVEAVLTNTYNLCFERIYEKYQNFLSENFYFLVVKFSMYLNRHVFVMLTSMQRDTLSS